MTQNIFSSMYQNKGAAYKAHQIRVHSHYSEPIVYSDNRLAGNSHIWGDASHEVQAQVIKKIIDTSLEKGLSSHQTAHVLAIAKHESGFNPDAAAGTTSAYGIGQFINKTAASYGIHTKEDRLNIDKQVNALVEHFIDNSKLAASRDKGEDYIYKYHHDGPTKDFGGLGLSHKHIMPLIKPYESIVNTYIHQNKDISHNKDMSANTQDKLELNRDILVQKLIDKTQGEIGYKEYGKEKTKYAEKHFPQVQGQFWCDTFVDSMFVEAFGRENAKKMLGGFSAATKESKKNFEEMGLWHDAKGYTPKPGDQIFFKYGRNGNPVDHTGIVTRVENGVVYTIEGNTNANANERNGTKVVEKSHSLTNKTIVGYGTPNWDVMLKQNIQKPDPKPEKTLEKQPVATSEKSAQEKSEKAADKVKKTEKVEPSPQLSPQAKKFSQQCEEKLVECCNKKGITADSPQDFKNISMALTVKGLENGMTRVEKLDIESRNSVVMVFILSNEPHAKLASVSANEAVNIPVQQSIEKIQQIEQQKTQEQQMHHSQTQGMQR